MKRQHRRHALDPLEIFYITREEAMKEIEAANNMSLYISVAGPKRLPTTDETEIETFRPRFK